MPRLLRSNLCHQAQLESRAFRGWAARLGERFHLYRKLWEWCFIAQALHERGLLRRGRRGLGFGVGKEPLTALFAGLGCEVVATDMDEEQSRREGWHWTEDNQHAAGLAALNERGLCDPEAFRRRVSFRVVDMNAIPADLRDFDFTWSACSLEHLGSIARGQDFLDNQMRCLRPGGVAVHTTEFNCSSEAETLDHFPTVLFRRCDIEAIADRLRAAGHAIGLDFDRGDGLADGFVDVPPYTFNPQLKLEVGAFVTTSIGLIIEKAAPPRRAALGLRRFLPAPAGRGTR